MVLKQIKSILSNTFFRETVQPIDRYEPGKYRLIGNKYTGSESSVSVVWKEVIDLDFHGFYHEHPLGYSQPSQTDDKTMDSWTKAIGKPLVLIIKSGKKMNGWIYFNDEKIPFKRILLQRFEVNRG